MKERWRRTASQAVFTAPIFSVREDQYEFEGRATHPYYVLESRPWVNVVAVTPDEQVVLVRQFRHGIQSDSLEIPGGIVDPGDASPADAAARELLEETGFVGRTPEPLLALSSNPAILDNITHSYVIADARKVGPAKPDAFEDIEVILEPRAQIIALIQQGRIHHSLNVAALFGYLATYNKG